MGWRWALASFLGRRLRCAVATRVRATSARIEAASPRRGGTAASCTVSMALFVRSCEEAAAAPLRAASKRPGARQRNEGCSGAAPGTQRKRVVSSNPPLGQRFIAAAPTDRRAFWALGLETRPPQECSRRPRHPSRTPTSTARRPREGEPARLSHVPCVSHSVPTARRESAVFTRQGLRRGRCRAAGTADAPPGLPPQRFYPLARLPTSTPSQRPLQSRPTPNKHPCPSK